MTLQEGPILHKPAHASPDEGKVATCMSYAPSTACRAGYWVPSGEERARGHHAFLSASFKEPGGEEGKPSQEMEGEGPELPAPLDATQGSVQPPAPPPSPGGSVVLPESPARSSASREAQAQLRRKAQQFISC